MLREGQREMQSVLHRRVRHTRPDGPNGGLDETEQAELDIQDDIEVAMIQFKGDTLRRVHEALVHLDAGGYGHCAECDGEISDKRLRAQPFAVRCTACEEAREQCAPRQQPYRTPHGFDWR
jgi:DnaK suppressor protein